MQDLVANSLKEYAAYILKETSWEVSVESSSQIKVEHRPQPGDHVKTIDLAVHKPIFLIYLRSSAEKIFLNREQVEANDKAIRVSPKSKPPFAGGRRAWKLIFCYLPYPGMA